MHHRFKSQSRPPTPMLVRMKERGYELLDLVQFTGLTATEVWNVIHGHSRPNDLFKYDKLIMMLRWSHEDFNSHMKIAKKMQSRV